jgi:serine/threonine protein kinase
MLIGSPEYMAPERVHGIEGDPASDLWSLALMLYVGLEGRNPLSRETTIATIAAVSEGYVPPPVRSGVIGPILSAVLVPDPSRRPSAEQLEAMLAQAEAGRSVTGFQAPAPPDPLFPGPDGNQFDATGREQIPVTYQLPGSPPRPPINPYGNPANPYAEGMSAEAAERYRSKAFRLTTMSTVCVLALMGFSVWASTRAQSHANQLDTTHANNVPTFSMPSIPDTQSTDSQSQPSGSPASTASSNSSSDSGSLTATQNLLTPAGVRSVTKQIFAVSGGNRVASLTVYGDHASYDVVKKDDPRVYDTYSFSNGKAEFSMTGTTLDEGQPALDPGQVDWDALPALLKDANSTLNVKNPKYQYVVLDSDIIDQTPQLKVYLADDYRSGYLLADLKGKVIKRYPEE